MLAQLTLPSTVQDESRFRVWQRRFYDVNIWSEKKRMEKLNYMHGNPVQRRLVSSPELMALVKLSLLSITSATIQS
jgi:hypothetical protein